MDVVYCCHCTSSQLRRAESDLEACGFVARLGWQVQFAIECLVRYEIDDTIDLANRFVFSAGVAADGTKVLADGTKVLADGTKVSLHEPLLLLTSSFSQSLGNTGFVRQLWYCADPCRRHEGLSRRDEDLG